MPQSLAAAMARAAGLLAACAAVPAGGAPVERCVLGAGGPSVSCVAYGTLHLHEAGSAASALEQLHAAVKLGITTFDLSDVYTQQPALFGEAIQLDPTLRQRIEVIAKMDIQKGGAVAFDSGSVYDTSPEWLDQVLAQYLSALNTTYIDIVLFHREDYIMDASSVADTFARWKREGKVRYFGTSNYQRDAFALLNSRLAPDTRLVTNEIEVSMLNPKALYDGQVAFHYASNTTVLAWSPVCGDPWGGANRLFKVGSLDGTPHNARLHKGLQDVAAELGAAEDVTAVAWVMRHPARIIPILGTMNPDRLANQSAAPALAARMTRKQWYHIADAAGVPLP